MRVPVYEQQTSLQGSAYRPESVAVPAPVQSGLTAIGVQIDKLGEAVATNERIVEAHAKTRQVADDRIAVADKVATFKINESSLLDEISISNISDPDFSGNYEKGFDSRSSDIRKSLTATQQALWDLDVLQFKVAQFERARKVQATEKINNRAVTLSETGKKHAYQVALSSDTATSFLSLTNEYLPLIRDVALPHSMKTKLEDAYLSEMSKSVVMTDASRDPALASERIETGFYSSMPGFNMPVDQLLVINKQLKSQINIRDNTLVAKNKDVVDQWMAKVAIGADPGAFPLSSEQVLQTFGPESALGVMDTVEAITELGPSIKGIATFSQAEVSKLEEAIRTSNDRPTVQQKKLTTINKLWSQVQSERNSDPGAALDRMAQTITPDTPMSTRLQIKAAYAINAGMSTSTLLSNSEVKQFVSEISTGDPLATEQRLKQLTRELDAASIVRHTDAKGVDTVVNIKDSVMKQLYSTGPSGGGLDRRFMVASFAEGTRFHKYFMSAITEKNPGDFISSLGGNKSGSLPQIVKNDLESSADYRQFKQNILKAASPNNTSLIADFDSVVYMAALKGSAVTGKSVAKELISDMIQSRYYVRSTFNAPKSAAPSDSELDNRLNFLKRNMKYPNGKKMDIAISSGNSFIDSTAGAKGMVANDANYVWLTHADGQGLYLGIYIPSAGQYQEVRDTDSKQIYVPYSDIARMEAYSFANTDNTTNKVPFKFGYRLK